MRTVLFIDRDGTIIREPDDHQVDSFDKLEFVPGVIGALAKISAETDHALVMVTNQDGLGTASFPEQDFLPVQEFVLKTLAGEGIAFEAVLIDRSFANEKLDTRKPGIGLLSRYINGEFDLANSFVIGDRGTDIQLAVNLGSKAILLAEAGASTIDPANESAHVASSWSAIYHMVSRPDRTASHRRRTNETDLTVELNLDGAGRSDIQTGIAFLDHMLDQLAKHGGVDLKIFGKGDLHVDEHHTIEDVAITLGEAFTLALGDKEGLERYGFCLPMDDSLAQVAIDFGGRNWIVWEAEFKRETIGGMPTEMFFHFFKTFTDHARCNLNIKAEGSIEHHKIEAIFKAFARAVRLAVRRGGDQLPSTKGIL